MRAVQSLLRKNGEVQGADTIAAIGATLLRAYEADRNAAADVPPKSDVPSIYRALGNTTDPNEEIFDLETGMPIEPPASESRHPLPTPSPSKPDDAVNPQVEVELVILV